MSEENVEVVRRNVDAFNRRDVDAFVADLSPAVEWEDPQFWSGESRIYRGRAEVREWLSQILEPWESIHLEANEIIATNDQVFVELSLSGRGKASGAEAELRHYVVAWFANGLCTRRRVFRERAEALEAAGLSE